MIRLALFLIPAPGARWELSVVNFSGGPEGRKAVPLWKYSTYAYLLPLLSGDFGRKKWYAPNQGMADQEPPICVFGTSHCPLIDPSA